MSSEQTPEAALVEELGRTMENFTNTSALMIAYERNLESGRTDALFQDPLAKYLMGPSKDGVSKGESISESFGVGACAPFGFEGWPQFHTQWTACRTRFIDDKIAECAGKSQKVEQFVNFGAGFDTRAHRVPCFEGFVNGSFEVDMDVLQDMKKQVFAKLDRAEISKSLCPVRCLSCDLMESNTTLRAGLESAGFDASTPAIFLAEGLIMYLGTDKGPKLAFLEAVSSVAAAGSALILNFIDVTDTPAEEVSKASSLSRADLKTFFEGAGWTDIEFFRWGDEPLCYGRFPLDKFKPSNIWSFVVCHKGS